METIDHPTPQDDDAVAVLVGLFQSTLLAFGLQSTKEIQDSFADRVVNSLGGAQLYFPRMGAVQRRRLHDWIRANWRGNNAKELSKATGLSERRIRQLVSEPARK